MATHVELFEEDLRTRVQIPPAPPLPSGKESLFTFEQPRWAPSLAGFFTSSCGLGVHPCRPNSSNFGPFSLSVLYFLRTVEVISPQHGIFQNQRVSDFLGQLVLLSIDRVLCGVEKGDLRKSAQAASYFTVHQLA